MLNFSSETENRALLVNNMDWYREMTAVHFLREIGKLFRVNVMLRKDSVRARLNRGEQDKVSVDRPA